MSPLRRALRPIMILATSLVLLTAVPAAPAHAIDRAATTTIRHRIEYLINRTRASHGLPRLRVSEYVTGTSTTHARSMARRGRLYHDSALRYEIPRGSTAWAENIARSTATNAARNVHHMFMGSSMHRSNLLNPRYTHMGIGVAKRGGYTYVVERFFRR